MSTKRKPPLPPNKVHRDRKNDYQRKPKHGEFMDAAYVQRLNRLFKAAALEKE